MEGPVVTRSVYWWQELPLCFPCRRSVSSPSLGQKSHLTIATNPFPHVTEVRCEEKSKGGLKYEVILSEPVLNSPPGPVTYRSTKSSSPPKQQSVEDIEKKLKAAEERRVSLEASKLATLQAQLERIDLTSRKREEKTTQFIQQTKETLGSKMEVIQYNREAILSDLKAKLRDHEKRIEMVRNNKERLSMHESDETASSG